MGPKSNNGVVETGIKALSELIKKNGFGSAIALVLIGAVVFFAWILLDRTFSSADCSREDARQCQASLVQVNQDNNAVLLEINKTLIRHEATNSRLALAVEMLERQLKNDSIIYRRALENGG